MGVVLLLLPVQFGARPAMVDGERLMSLGAPVTVFYDGLPNPVGWLLVLWGIAALPASFPRQRPLLVGSLLSFAVSVPLWLPSVQEQTLAAPELGWVASLPQGVTLVLLCLALIEAPDEAGLTAPLPEGRTYPVFGLRTTAIALGAALAAPPMIFGAGLEWAALPAGAASGLGLLYLIWTLFRLHAYVPAPDDARRLSQPGP